MSFFTPNTDFLPTQNEKGRYLLVWRLSIILTLLFLILTLLVMNINIHAAIFYEISLGLCVFIFLYLLFSRNIQHIFWLFTISATVVVSTSLHTMLDTLHYPDFIWCICTIMFAYIGLGKRVGLVFLIIHVLSMSYYFLYGINNHLDQLKVLSMAEQISILFEMLTAFFALTYLINQYLSFQKQTEKELAASNKELMRKNVQNELLMKEIHHRIKNNLQLVVSLLRMQEMEVRDPEGQAQFAEAISRIMSISIIHRKLYQSEELQSFDLSLYIEDLINEIKSLQGRDVEVKINLTVHVDAIGMKTVVPLGLMLNELITNSFKHVFKPNEQNEMQIRIEKLTEGYLHFSYFDHGNWIDSAGGFGVDLIEMLVVQMEGSLKREGNYYNFRLKNLDLD